MRRKIHYVVKPEHLWNNIAEMARTQNDQLLVTLEEGFRNSEEKQMAVRSANYTVSLPIRLLVYVESRRILWQKILDLKVMVYQQFKKLRTPPTFNSLPKILYTNNLGCVRRLGGKPARAEAAGDAAAKKRACELFLSPCVPTACARGLGTGRRPRAQRGDTP
jgi:hypothetical protein